MSLRILKAAYYPEGTILTTVLGSHPCQIWRSILEGRDITKQGIIRRTGNGQTTNIWTDNWIPKDSSLRLVLSLIDNPPVMVSDLLQPSSATWNEEYIRSIFLPIDVDEVIKIPVCTRNS